MDTSKSLSVGKKYSDFKSTYSIERFEKEATKILKQVKVDERIFKCLAIMQGGPHKADNIKKILSMGGKVNSALGFLLSATPITAPIGYTILGANFANQTAMVAAAEKKILKLDNLAIAGGIDLPGTAMAMAYAHNKLKRKRKREAIGALPLGGLVGARAAFKHRNKEHKGTRQIYAMILWNNAIKGDKIAAGACDALTGDKSGKILSSNDFKSMTDIKNHNMVLNNKDMRKALGLFKSIAESMKTT